jgi:hypothetical protein
MHRSGTSAVARLVNLLGVPLGNPDDLMAADGANRAGYWESSALTEFQEVLLHRLGGSWDSPPPLSPGWERDVRLLPYLGRGRRLHGRIYGNAPFWSWKDPRTALTMPFWLRALEVRLLSIVVHRHPLDVAGSLAARDGIPKADALAIWERYNREILQNAAGVPAYVLSYESLLEKPVEHAVALRTFLAANQVPVRDVPRDAVADFVDSDLRHNESDLEALLRDSDVTEAQRDLSQAMKELEGSHASLPLIGREASGRDAP